MKAVWQLLRLEHGIMYGIGVLVGIYIADQSYNDFLRVVFGFLTALFLQASAFALNDYLDYEVDLVNERFDRPLVRGELKRSHALILALLLLPFGLVSASLISPTALTFALVMVLAGYLYDFKLKEYGFIGNVYIALSMAAPFAFGSIVALDKITNSVLLLSLIAFLSGLGREIMKGIEDVRGDSIRNVRSIARVKGLKFASRLSATLFLLAVVLSFLPVLFIKNYFDVKYIIPIFVADVLFVYTAFKLVKEYDKESIKRYRKNTLIAMSFGLIGFLIGAF